MIWVWSITSPKFIIQCSNDYTFTLIAKLVQSFTSEFRSTNLVIQLEMFHLDRSGLQGLDQHLQFVLHSKQEPAKKYFSDFHDGNLDQKNLSSEKILTKNLKTLNQTNFSENLINFLATYFDVAGWMRLVEMTKKIWLNLTL